MKTKIISAFLAVIILLSTFAVNAFAAPVPDNDELDDLFNRIGFASMMAGESYFRCDAMAPGGNNAPDSLVFEFMMFTPALQDYAQDEGYYTSYTVPYDEYMLLVDDVFVNHSDIKNYLRENEWINYNEETGIISWEQGGVGGPVVWVATCYSYYDELIYVNGVYADLDFNTDGMTENKDYIVINESGEEYKAEIKERLLLTIKYVDGKWKLLEYCPVGYHVVDGVMYVDEDFVEEHDRYYSLSINENNAVVEEYENSKDFAAHFYGNDMSWVAEGQILQYKVAAEEGYTVSYVTLTDDRGTRVADLSGENIYTISPVGVSTLDVVTREKGETPFEEILYRIMDFFSAMRIRIVSFFSIFGIA